jgi:hypothetical protein
MGLKDKLLGTSSKLKVVKVELSDELAALLDGETAYVRDMTASEFSSVEASRFVEIRTPDGKRDSRLDMTLDRERVIVRCLCDADGRRVFDDDDVPAVSLVHGRLADAIYEAALIQNGMKNDARDKELEKNSTTASCSSPAGSP